jgi:hypothetical protein
MIDPASENGQPFFNTRRDETHFLPVIADVALDRFGLP